MDLALYLFIALSVLATSIVSGALGMAGGMILMGLLTWVLPVQQAMLIHAASQFFSNGNRAFVYRKDLYTPTIKYYLLGLAITFALLCLITFSPNKIAVFAMLGISPLVSYLIPQNSRFSFSFSKPLNAFFCGVIVTCFHLTSGVSGPLLDIFFRKTPMTRFAVVSTKAFTQLVSHAVKFIYFSFIITTASKTAADLPLSIYLTVIITALIGSSTSKYLLNRITDNQFHEATQLVIIIVGSVYLIKAFMLI